MVEVVVTEKEETAEEESKKPKFTNGEGVIPALRQCASYEQFQTWITDLESYFKTAQISDPEKKYSMLMIHGGPFLNEIVRSRRHAAREHIVDTGTETDTKKQEETSIESTLDGYETTKKILVENYVPNSNVNVERMKFRASQPSVGDSHKQFLEKLKKKARYCGFDNGYSSEQAIVEQFMDKCLWGHLKTRLSFESNLTINKILEVADEMRKSMPAGKDIRFEKPGSSELYKTFPNKYSLEAQVNSVLSCYLIS
ncbi:hypothetical protein ACHWQZ_G014292 [Mnemiopsis leidyi]